MSVRLGAHSIRANDGQSIPVSRVIVHPGWGSGRANENDIALLKLNGTANNQYVRAALPTQAVQNIAASPGKQVTVSGWGNTSANGSGSDVLMEVDLPVLNNQQCSQELGTIPDSSICGSGANGRSACYGDSGGPYAAEHNGIFYSFGTVSWGQACRSATVFTRTLSFVSWITDNTGITPPDGDNPPPPPGDDEVIEEMDLSGNRGSVVYYRLKVPAGRTTVRVTISGGSGDADLYVRRGGKPTENSYDCRPYRNGNNEVCDLEARAGIYHIMVKGYSRYSGVTLKGSSK